MLPHSLCFLDLETTGGSPTFHRIIDIGIVKMVDGAIVDTYTSLVDPEMGVDPYISQMTGITPADLERAPVFETIKRDVLDFIQDSIIVAHNVRFDYSFLRQELKRCGITFSSKHVCTVKLARHLFPGQSRYNLDAIIERFGINCERRHRAYDDAKAIADFYHIARQIKGDAAVAAAIDAVMKRPSLPIGLDPQTIDNLPENPGVYLFYGDNDTLLYVGKSVNIRDRVLSHFSNDHESREMRISQDIRHIDHIETAGELGALLLESTLIKKYQPLLNRQLRHARLMTILTGRTHENGYMTVASQEVDAIDAHDLDTLLGIFKSHKQMIDTLYVLAKEYRLCPKLLGLEKGKGACFSSHLGQCTGACIGKESAVRYNMRFIEAFAQFKLKQWPFPGPILLHEAGETHEGFIIDKWCLLGNVKESDTLPELHHDYRFDLDVYKILVKFILDPKSKVRMHNVSFPVPDTTREIVYGEDYI